MAREPLFGSKEEYEKSQIRLMRRAIGIHEKRKAEEAAKAVTPTAAPTIDQVAEAVIAKLKPASPETEADTRPGWKRLLGLK